MFKIFYLLIGTLVAQSSYKEEEFGLNQLACGSVTIGY